MCGFIAQLVEHRTGIAEVTGSNPVEALIFFRLLISSCLSWRIYCDDHSSLSSTTAVHIWYYFIYTSHQDQEWKGNSSSWWRLQILEETSRLTAIFWESKKIYIFAMIRQLGPATLFCNFPFLSAETQWTHLLRIVGKLFGDKEYSDTELKNLTWEEKSRLIPIDPLTCARHFDYQLNHF